MENLLEVIEARLKDIEVLMDGCEGLDSAEVNQLIGKKDELLLIHDYCSRMGCESRKV